MPEAAPPRLPSREGWLGREAVLVPVKAFRDAKVRLAPAMSGTERAALAQEDGDPGGRLRGRAARGGGVRRPGGGGLGPRARRPGDLGAGTRAQRGRAGRGGPTGRGRGGFGRGGCRRPAVGHRPALGHPLSRRHHRPGPAPRRHQRHRASRPTAGFTFSYGPGSFARHLDEARRLGLPIRVVHSTPLGWDVDVPDDLAAVTG